MKRAVLFCTLLLSAAGYVYLQTTSPAPKLATIMPGGALLYLEARDFGGLLRDWDTSTVKAAWLTSASYAVFSRSNLFAKLQEVYGQYGEAAGFLPNLQSVIEIAGTDSALALYEIRDVEFLYVSRIGNADLIKSQLWSVRDKFEQRQAGGTAFYLRIDPASRRTVAFAFAKGYLFLATRDDLIAQALELAAGSGSQSIDSDRWYHDAAALAPKSGELRLVMNLESLVKSDPFRSYWIQRNASTIRRYWAGVADVSRTDGNVTEDRVFLRSPVAAESTPAAADPGTVPRLLALVPPEAGLYKVARVSESAEVAALIVHKLIGPEPRPSRDWRDAPLPVSTDNRAGSESDLETRIDEQPLPSDAGISQSVAAARAMVDKAGGKALLLVQSSSLSGTFVRTPSVIVLEGVEEWDRDSVRTALAAAAGKRWTTSQLGAGWVTAAAGRHAIERLDGLGTLVFANRGKLLFLSDDLRLLAAVLDRVGSRPAAGILTYAAGIRLLLERAGYNRVMAALELAGVGGDTESGQANRTDGRPAFFSGTIGSLTRALSRVAEIRATEEEQANVTRQTVVYQLAH